MAFVLFSLVDSTIRGEERRGKIALRDTASLYSLLFEAYNMWHLVPIYSDVACALLIFLMFIYNI